MVRRVQDVTVREVDRRLPEALRVCGQVMRAYQARNWHLAEVNLVNLRRLAPRRRLYQVFSERVADARRRSTAADRGPVTVFEEK